MRTRTFIAALVGLAVACTPPRDDPPDPPPSGDAALVTQGEAVYEVVCWACHGLGGHGDGPAADSLEGYRPPTVHTQDFANASPRRLEQLFGLAQADDPDHPHALYVTPFLSDEGLTDAVAYVSDLAYPPEVPGSARNGARLFRRQCAGCHGPEGRGHGELRVFLIAEDAIDLTLEPVLEQNPWDELYEILSVGEDQFHGVQTPPWSAILTEAEIWDLVAHIAVLRATAI